LLNEPTVAETLELARQADLILIGIGAVGPELVAVNPAYQQVAVPVEKVEPGGAIGAICGQLFDINGEVLDIDINKRTVGLELESLKKSKRVIAIAGGESKDLAILGALRGGYIDVIITDEKAARRVLALDRQMRPL
jgi:DNA-binding transcriptional regulator LsrR (DeoR family)